MRNTVLDNFFIFVIQSVYTFFEIENIAYNCIINRYLAFTIYDLAKFNISTFTKDVPFLFHSGLKRRNNPAGFERVNTFCKVLMVKVHYFLAVRCCYIVLRWSYNFMKICRGVPFVIVNSYYQTRTIFVQLLKSDSYGSMIYRQ